MSAIGSDGFIELSGHGHAEVFTAAGIKVAMTDCNGSSRLSVAPGLYIVHMGAKASKVTVR